jgi:hypothetical protein
LAIEKGYLRGALKGGANADTAPDLPADYIQEAKAVAERQGALAGCRLADEIQKYLKCGGVVPLLPENTNIAPQIAMPAKIGAAEAGNYYDESMIVTGKIVQVTIRPTIVILSLDQPFSNSPMTAVIFSDHAGKFGDLQRFNNQNVEISGTITPYHNKPEMVLESPGQIKVVEGK